MAYALFLIAGNLVFYAVTASPGLGCMLYLIDHRILSARVTTTLVVILAAIFAPAFVGMGHTPVLMPFVASPLLDSYHSGYTWKNAVAAALTAGVVLAFRVRTAHSVKSA